MSRSAWIRIIIATALFAVVVVALRRGGAGAPGEGEVRDPRAGAGDTTLPPDQRQSREHGRGVGDDGHLELPDQESLEGRLRRYEAEVGLESGGMGGDAAFEVAESAPAEQSALRRFDRRYSDDRFGAAEEVQAGAFPEVANDRQQVRDLAKGLAAQSAPAALQWALAWKNEPTRLTSVAAVIESWVQLDPMACSKHVGNITDQQSRDVAAGQLAIYLSRMGSREEAAAWLESIQSSQVRSDTEALIAE